MVCDGTTRRGVKDYLNFIWFLNLASAYCNENHTPESYWLIGCCGPFGVVDKDLLGKIRFPSLKLDDKVTAKQTDVFNCGVIWCLFMHEVMQQSFISYTFSFEKRRINQLPLSTGIGKTWIHPTLYGYLIGNQIKTISEKLKSMQKDYEITLYQAFRVEMVVALERLRHLVVQKEAGSDGVHVPAYWGVTPNDYNESTKHIRSVIFHDKRKLESPNLVQAENTECIKFWSEAGPLVPGSLFLVPCEQLLNSRKLNDWFPAFNNETSFADLSPIVLPFDKLKYLQEIKDIIIQPKSVMMIDLENIPTENVSNIVNKHMVQDKADMLLAEQMAINPDLTNRNKQTLETADILTNLELIDSQTASHETFYDTIESQNTHHEVFFDPEVPSGFAVASLPLPTNKSPTDNEEDDDNKSYSNIPKYPHTPNYKQLKKTQFSNSSSSSDIEESEQEDENESSNVSTREEPLFSSSDSDEEHENNIESHEQTTKMKSNRHLLPLSGGRKEPRLKRSKSEEDIDPMMALKIAAHEPREETEEWENTGKFDHLLRKD